MSIMTNLNDNVIYNTYNLTVVAFCEKERAANLIKHFKDEIYGSFKEHIDFYNLDSLGRAEVEPERLKKMSKMIFCCSDDFHKTFLGFASDRTIAERHKILFGTRSSLDLKYFLTPTPKLTKESLTKISEERFGTYNRFGESFDHDITVSFKTEPTQDSRGYTEISCAVSPRLIVPFDVIECFIEIIEKADRLFPDELCSAYISYAPEHMSVTHKSMCFRYRRQNVTEYILGAEWFVYMGKQIKNKPDAEILTSISNHASVTEHENGISYKATCDISEFDKYRSYFHTLFDDLLIPAYGEIGWEEICKGTVHYAVRPKCIHVFRLAPNFERIVLSHNCSIEDICRYDVITSDDLMFSL